MSPLADWDPRLLAPETALHLTGDWPIYVSCERADLGQFDMEGGGPSPQGAQWQVNLRCAAPPCNGRSITLLASVPESEIRDGSIAGAPTDLGELMSAILRHLVMAHDQPLSGGKAHG
jgi:hypothetical protein